jgi:hypothetical protein
MGGRADTLDAASSSIALLTLVATSSDIAASAGTLLALGWRLITAAANAWSMQPGAQRKKTVARCGRTKACVAPFLMTERQRLHRALLVGARPMRYEFGRALKAILLSVSGALTLTPQPKVCLYRKDGSQHFYSCSDDCAR